MKILNRAKSIYSDEYLISEDIKFELGLMYLRINGKWKECDKDTRSINFEDMIDSQGKEIFASLSEDGKGGSLIQMGKGCISRTLVYKYGQFWFTDFSNNQLNSTTFTQAAFNIHFTEKFNKINRLRNYINEIIVSGIQE